MSRLFFYLRADSSSGVAPLLESTLTKISNKLFMVIKISNQGGMITYIVANESMIMRLTKQEDGDCSVVSCARDPLQIFVELVNC